MLRSKNRRPVDISLSEKSLIGIKSGIYNQLKFHSRCIKIICHGVVVFFFRGKTNPKVAKNCSSHMRKLEKQSACMNF